jgi:hypothetical protein
MQQAKRQKEAVEAIVKAGGWVRYEYQNPFSGVRSPPYPAWLRKLLGDDLFNGVVLAGVVGDSELKHLDKLPQLREVSIVDTAITDAGVKQLKGLPQIRTLLVQGNQVTDVELEHLEELFQLEELILSGTKVTDDGIKKFHRALPNCKVAM